MCLSYTKAIRIKMFEDNTVNFWNVVKFSFVHKQYSQPVRELGFEKYNTATHISHGFRTIWIMEVWVPIKNKLNRVKPCLPVGQLVAVVLGLYEPLRSS